MSAAAEQTGGAPRKDYDDSCLEILIEQRQISSVAVLAFIIAVIGIAFSIFHLFAAYFGQAQSYLHRTMHVTLMIVLCILLRPTGRKSWRDPINAWFAWDIVCLTLTLAVQAYICWGTIDMIQRRGAPTNVDLIVGVVMILLVMEGTRRAVGWLMVAMAVFFIFQSAYGEKFFWIFYGPNVDWMLIINDLFMEEEGIYTIPIAISASYVVLFIIFGAFLMRSGVGALFNDIAFGLMGRQIGGAAKTAVVSSAFMASISGSAVSNVVTTGSFTIPMMKRMGYRPEFAAAVEACASTGGVFTPPIMGAVAFIMAEFLGVSYWEVVKAAAIPAALYYVAVFSVIHFRSHRYDLKPDPNTPIPKVADALRTRGHLLLPIFAIVGVMMIGYSAMFAALVGIATVFAASWLRADTRMSATSFLGALEDAARMMISVAVPSAAAGLIVGAIYLSGLAVRFSSTIVDIAAGNLVLALVFAMILCLILGMGITVTALYILVAAMVVPAIVKLGVEPMAAHLFAFHFGVHSYITPPVALSAFAAAAIAKSPPMRTGVESARLGFAAYLIPFMFVFAPGLLLIGDWSTIIVAIATAAAGIVAFAAALEGWLVSLLPNWQRIVLATGAVFLIMTPIWTHIVGFGLVSVIVALQLLFRRNAQAGAMQ